MRGFSEYVLFHSYPGQSCRHWTNNSLGLHAHLASPPTGNPLASQPQKTASPLPMEPFFSSLLCYSCVTFYYKLMYEKNTYSVEHCDFYPFFR